MQKILTLSLFILFGSCAFAQQNPVKWSNSVKKIGDKTYEIHITATIQNGWHIYSVSTPEGGPFPTTVNFTKNPLLTMVGNIKEKGKLQQKFEEVFGIDVKYFSNTVDFVQVVKLKSNVKTSVNGTIEYMVCTDKECLPPTKAPFVISLTP